MSVAPGAGRGPSAMLPLAYLLVAAAAFVTAAIGVVWLAPELTGHYYHPRVLALTHTVTLGWITVTIFGASYQLIPVVLERPLWSERLARWQLGVLLVGLGGLIPHFFIARGSGLAWAAALVAAAATAHVVNVALTLRGLPAWSFTARLVALAHVGLGLTAVSGALLGVDRAWKFLPGGALANVHAHAHLALLGWVLPMVVGVAARVYPMFLLAREPRGRAGAVQLGGIALGVPALVIGLAAGVPALVVAGAVAIAAAVAAHVVWIAGVVRTRKRPQLDWPLRFVLTGTAFAVPATAMGLALAFDVTGGPRWALAYVTLILGGWASLTLAGMMLKVVPFLVWYRVYGPRVGRMPVPTLADLSAGRFESVAYWLLGGGVVALAVALAVGDLAAIRGAGVVLGTGAVAFATALGHVVVHLVRRVPEHRAPAGFVTERAS